jgi:hypothetical protein
MALVVEIVAGIVVAVLAWLCHAVWDRTSVSRKYRHIKSLLKGFTVVQIVVPTIGRPTSIEWEFESVRYDSSKPVPLPCNVRFAPLDEGYSIGRVVVLLKSVSPKLLTNIVSADRYDERVPAFLIGGPDMNRATDKFLFDNFPAFSINYPEVSRAYFGHEIFEAVESGNGIVRDYGFVFLSKNLMGAPVVVLCGIHAFGTALAADYFSDAGRNSAIARNIRDRRESAMIVKGDVNRLNRGMPVLLMEVTPTGRQLR